MPQWSLIYDEKAALRIETADFGDSNIRGVSIRRVNSTTPAEIRQVARLLADLMIAELGGRPAGRPLARRSDDRGT